MRSQRHEDILSWLSEEGRLSVEAVCERMGASPATVRRDFGELSEDPRVQRVRGGIRWMDQGPAAPFAVREIQESQAKRTIAERAAALLEPGDVIFIDGGTTTLQLASCLPPIQLRIITNSLSLAAAIESQSQGRSRWEVFLIGGYLFPASGLLVGPSAQAGLTQYHASWAFLSAGGLTTQGLFNANEHVVESERIMIRNADRVAVLADHTKMGRTAMCHIAPLQDIDVLVTDSEIESDSIQSALQQHGIQVNVGKSSTG